MEDAVVVPEGQEQLSQEVQTELDNPEAGADSFESDGEPTEAEIEAASLGWKKGGSLSASEYIEHKDVLSSKERSKRLIEENIQLKARQEEIAARLEKQEQAAEEYREFQTAAHKREIERLKTEANAQIAGLKQQRAEAIRNGDGEAVNDIDDRIDALKERSREVEKPAVEVKTQTQQKPSASATPPNHPEFDPWLDENKWFKDDEEMRSVAEGIARSMKLNGDTSEGKVFFDKVKERVRKVYPDKFGNPNRSRPNVVESSSSAASFKGKTARDLDKEGAALMKAAIAAGAYKKKAKELKTSEESLFLKDYFS